MATSLIPPPPGFVLDSEPKQPTPAPPAGFVLDSAPAATPPPPPGFAIDPPRRTAADLIADPDFQPEAYAHQTGDIETAFEADQLLRARTFGQKAASFGRTLLQPATWGNAALSAAKFAGGLVTTPLHATAQAATVFVPCEAAGKDGFQMR